MSMTDRQGDTLHSASLHIFCTTSTVSWYPWSIYTQRKSGLDWLILLRGGSCALHWLLLLLL